MINRSYERLVYIQEIVLNLTRCILTLVKQTLNKQLMFLFISNNTLLQLRVYQRAAIRYHTQDAQSNQTDFPRQHLQGLDVLFSHQCVIIYRMLKE